MAVFKIGGGPYYAYLTADSTQYTADSTEITADMTYTDVFDYQLRVMPRSQPSSVKVRLKRDITNEVFFIEDPYFTFVNGYLTILFNFDFELGQQYEVRIFNEKDEEINKEYGEVIGQEDLENYKLTKPDTTGKLKMKY